MQEVVKVANWVLTPPTKGGTLWSVSHKGEHVGYAIKNKYELGPRLFTLTTLLRSVEPREREFAIELFNLQLKR